MENIFNENDIALAEKLHRNELTAEEKAALENRLKNDELFKKEFEEYYALIDALEFNLLKEKLNENEVFETSNQEKGEEAGKVVSIFSQQKFWLRAAAVMLFGAFSLLLVNNFSNNNHTQLANSNLILPNANTLKIPSIEEIDVNSIFEQYQDKSYNSVIKNADNALAQIEIDKSELLGDQSALLKNELNLKLQKALALTKQNKNEKLAIQYLNEIIQTGEMPIANYAKWNKALVQIKMGKVDDAKLVLNQFANTNNAFTTKAKEILKQL